MNLLSSFMDRKEHHMKAGMMQCLATGVRSRTRRGHRWWWEVRGGGRNGGGKRAERQLPVSNGPNGCPS